MPTPPYTQTKHTFPNVQGIVIISQLPIFFLFMSLSQLQTLQHLARIYLESDELESLNKDLGKVFSWISELETLCVRGMPDGIAPSMTLRPDIVAQGGTAPLILSNAPYAKESFFIVPKVLKS
jgi:aspartyl-tRNA(Asn)/glutamyl-tRNA(Gln) amidotransferase subunit C